MHGGLLRGEPRLLAAPREAANEEFSRLAKEILAAGGVQRRSLPKRSDGVADRDEYADATPRCFAISL
ncbi:hypothetical protein bcgnr5379_63210 [Bacillus cereus]